MKVVSSNNNPKTNIRTKCINIKPQAKEKERRETNTLRTFGLTMTYSRGERSLHFTIIRVLQRDYKKLAYKLLKNQP